MQTYNVVIDGKNVSAVRAYTAARALRMAQAIFGPLALVARP
jgi:hypothetical protein